MSEAERPLTIGDIRLICAVPVLRWQAVAFLRKAAETRTGAVRSDLLHLADLFEACDKPYPDGTAPVPKPETIQ